MRQLSMEASCLPEELWQTKHREGPSENTTTSGLGFRVITGLGFRV